MGRYTVSLDSRAALRESLSGGKGSNLARARRYGFNVPPGYVVTPAAFQDFLADLGIEILAERQDWTQSDLGRIVELLTVCRIPDSISNPIVDSYRGLGGRVAVRSSMIGEDTSTTSFAGQLDTTLDVQGAGPVLEAVKRCWTSLFNWRLLSYISERELLSPQTVLERFAIAVVVQQMVDTEAAGVAFSADPLTGERCVVIEAARSLGDAVVQGLVEPDRYRVDARGALAEATPINADVPVLAEQQILRLTDLVRDLASRLRAPQDVEWAWDGTCFWLLQCRPISMLSGRRVYSNRMVSDMSPGLVKPLVYSTNTLAMTRNVFGRIFTELIGPNEIDFTPLVKRIHSRIYTDVTLLGELFERIGLPANFFQMVSRDETAERRRPPLNLGLLRALVRLLRSAWRHGRAVPEIRGFIERHHRLLEAYRGADWSSEDPRALLVQLEGLVELHGGTQWHVFVSAINMAARNRLLNRLVERRAPEVVPSDLIRGLLGLKALEPNEELRRLALQAKALGDDVHRLLAEEDDGTIRAKLSTSAGGQSLVHQVEAFLTRYGFLSTSGTDFTTTPWVESPTLIWRAIGRAAVSSPEVARADLAAVREEARERVRTNLNWAQRLFFDRLLRSTITYIDLRERTSLLMSQDSYQMRRIFLTLGEAFVARSQLEQRDDVFYLYRDEVQHLVEGALEGAVARERVAARRAEMEADAQIELPATICGDYVPTQPVSLANGQECLVGISGSSGLAQGYARVIVDPTEAPATLSKDDILIVPFTDVGWTPLFTGIGGIVAETGGQLSHTSIVAREYGLPAVVNIKKATLLIKDGQPITVDGDNGKVYLR